MKPNKLIAGVAALLLAGCAEAFRYDPETVESVSGRLPPVVPASATTQAFTDGYAALESGDYATAEAMLGRSLSQQPQDPYALLAMGAVMERTGRFFDASTYYRSAARYGTASPLGRTISIDGGVSEDARTVRDLALANIARLAPR